MRVAIESWPKSRELTLLDTVKLETGAGSGDDAFLTKLIRESTDAVERITRRSLSRTQWRASMHGTGRQLMRLPKLPVLRIDGLYYDGAAVDETMVEIVDADKGIVYLQSGWPTSIAPDAGFASSDRLAWDIVFIAGFLLPGDDITGSATISMQAGDDSFNDSASAFPPLLVAGDWLTAGGFTATAVNTRHKVSGMPTAAKIITASVLPDEAVGAGRSILVRNLPEELERAAIDMAKSRFYARSSDASSEIQSEEVDGIKTSYGTSASASDKLIETRIASQIDSWIVKTPGLMSRELVRS